MDWWPCCRNSRYKSTEYFGESWIKVIVPAFSKKCWGVNSVTNVFYFAFGRLIKWLLKRRGSWDLFFDQKVTLKLDFFFFFSNPILKLLLKWHVLASYLIFLPLLWNNGRVYSSYPVCVCVCTYQIRVWMNVLMYNVKLCPETFKWMQHKERSVANKKGYSPCLSFWIIPLCMKLLPWPYLMYCVELVEH